jgi:DNA-directed RNA polymerase specialized sigma24 family protein
MQSDSLDSDEPITLWIRQLEEGESEAAKPLWDHFCAKLMEMADRRLSPRLRRTYDHEDAALSAFHSLCRVVSERKTDLHGRVNLWRLLITITERKISNRVREEHREKRDVRRTVTESCMIDKGGDGALNKVAGREPSPEFAIEFADLCESLVLQLNDDTMKEIALLTLQSFDTDAVADRLGLSRRTVERKLLIIRNRWLKFEVARA